MDAPFKKTSVLETQLPITVENCHDLIRSLFNTVNELFKRVEKLEENNRK